VTGRLPTTAEVRRFTTEYIVPEDRIRLALERDDGDVLVLWLTRRLTIRMVKHIVKVIDSLPRLQRGGDPAPPSDNAQRRNQLEALGKIEQQAPVLSGPLPGDIDAYLITEIGLRLTKFGAFLDFKVGKDQVVQSLPFPEEALRQWLGVLHMNFRKAQWGDDIWPVWITARGGEKGPDALRLN
jgi:hypothetical protein